jgi:hypothetical protein
MPSSLRFCLLGTYKTPRFRVGVLLPCAYRGEDVIVVRFSAGQIPWPVGKRAGKAGSGLVLYGDLAKAVRRESNQAVAHWFGAPRPSGFGGSRSASDRTTRGRTSCGSTTPRRTGTSEPLARAGTPPGRPNAGRASAGSCRGRSGRPTSSKRCVGRRQGCHTRHKSRPQ